MAIIEYRFADGSVSEVKVDEGFGKAYDCLMKKESAVNRQETRRHHSLERLVECGCGFADSKDFVDNSAELKQIKRVLYFVLKLLSERQYYSLINHAIAKKSFNKIGFHME